MKFTDIKEISVSELLNKRTEMRENLFNAKMKNALGQTANPLEIRTIRKSIAKIETALTQKRSK